MTTRAIVAIVILLVALATYPGAVAVSMIVRLTPPPTVSTPAVAGVVPWLHVEHPQSGTPYISDDLGRLVLLHGAVPASLLDLGSSDKSRTDSPPVYPIDPTAYEAGRCPDPSAASPYPPLCQSDIAQMAALGFNSLRLPLSWSLLEPVRGQFSQAYIDRLAQVVDWARAFGMHVIIDMHQNAYSRYVGQGKDVDLRYNSGAPAWATLTDGLPSQVFAGQREANPAVFEAFSNFWYNRSGIQGEYIAAVGVLAKRFKDDSAVAGYSIFNEPQPGWNMPPGFEDLLLFPFYRRVIDAVTGTHDGLPCPGGIFMPAFCGYADAGVHDVRHIFFLEPGLLRQMTDFPTHLGLPLSSYPNLAYDIHAYTHGFTLEALLGNHDPSKATYPWGGYDQTYSLGEREAKVIGAALFVSEFGNDPMHDNLLLANETLQQEKHHVGFAFWTWKENGNSHAWGVFDPPGAGLTPVPYSGCLRTSRERLLARAYPRASSDPAPSYHYDPAGGSFTMQAHGSAGDPPTVVYIPPEVRGAVAVSGTAAPVTDTNPDGSRLVTATPSGGPFSIVVGPAPLALAGCG